MAKNLMHLKKREPIKAIKWYAKTSVITFLTIIIFIVLLLLTNQIFLNIIKNTGISAIISVLISVAITIIFLLYANKKLVGEWQQENKANQSIANIIATLFVVLFVTFFLLRLFTEININKIASVIFIILFLLYVYFKFLKK